MKTLTKLGMILASVGLLAFGCGKGDQNSVSGGSSGAGSGGGGTTTPKDASKIYVKVIQDDNHPMTTYLHKFNNFTSACEIASTAGPTDLKCLLNVREEELYFYGVRFEVNVPGSMCAFIYDDAYWYYNHRIGVGPSSISLNIESPVADAKPVLNACTVDGVAGTISGNYCVFPGDEGFVDATGEPYCAYNIEDGPQCCMGKYSVAMTTKTIVTENGTPKTTITPTNTKGEYGGDWKNCYSGYGSQTEWPKGGGYPVRQIYEGRNGRLIDTNVKAPLKVFGGRKNVYAANMYSWTAYAASNHTAGGTIPFAVKPTRDLTPGSTIYPREGNEAYTYGCYDESGELRHRIRVYVNEWNTNTEWTTYATSGGVTADPDKTGVDGVNCAVGGAVSASMCNDSEDWDDVDGAAGDNFPEEYTEQTQ